MKLTTQRLKQLIKEELESVMNETEEEEYYRSLYNYSGGDPRGFGFADEAEREEKEAAEREKANAKFALKNKLEDLKDEIPMLKRMLSGTSAVSDDEANMAKDRLEKVQAEIARIKALMKQS